MAKAPSARDTVVKVRAYLDDEYFGYDYWIARQFMAGDGAKPALLVIFDSEAERDAAFASESERKAATR